MKGDRHGALHFCPGDLRQILGIEDEEVSWSLGAGSHHNGQQHSWGHSTRLISITLSVGLYVLCLYCWWHTIILIYPIRSLNKQRLWGVGVWFLPYPGLLGLHIQLADLHASKSVNEKLCFTHSESLSIEGILSTYPVWYEMVETQAIGVCVILPSVPLVVNLRELECYKNNIKMVT